MKNIYLLDRASSDDQYAQACRLGTWKNEGKGLCEECTRSFSTRIPPLLAEWQNGPTEIADFTLPGFRDDLLVSERVKYIFANGYKGATMIPAINSFSSKIKSKKKLEAMRLSILAKGPLWDMWVTTWHHIDVEASKISVRKKCNTCNTIFYNAPKSNQEIYVKANGNDPDIFKTHEYPAWIFISDRLATRIKEERFTNINLVRYGRLV